MKLTTKQKDIIRPEWDKMQDFINKTEREIKLTEAAPDMLAALQKIRTEVIKHFEQNCFEDGHPKPWLSVDMKNFLGAIAETAEISIQKATK